MNQFRQKITIIFVQYFKPLIFLMVLIIFGLGYSLFIKPSLLELKENRNNLINLKQNELIAKGKELKDLKILKKEYQKLEGLEVQKLIAIVPFEKNIADLFKELENLTQKSGVSLLSLDIAEGETIEIINFDKNKDETSLAKSKNFKSLNISMEVGGLNYFTLKVLLNNLEKNIRLMNVNSFGFNLSNKSQKINLKTYYLE